MSDGLLVNKIFLAMLRNPSTSLPVLEKPSPPLFLPLVNAAGFRLTPDPARRPSILEL